MTLKEGFKKELTKVYLIYIPLVEQYFETLSFLVIFNTEFPRLKAIVSVFILTILALVHHHIIISGFH